MQFITRPLEKWPRPANTNRKRGNYSLSWDRVLRHLEKELQSLVVKGDVIVQIDIAEAKISRSGLPYSGERPNSPRVAIAFTCKHGPLTYYCDRFLDWQSNVRAIGLGLERLRLVEETGIVSRGEQYTGFKQLPGGIPVGAAQMTIEEAARFVSFEAASLHIYASPVDRDRACTIGTETILSGEQGFTTLYRIAAKRLHPDAQGGGNAEKWNKLQEAAAVLEKYYKEKGGV